MTSQTLDKADKVFEGLLSRVGGSSLSYCDPELKRTFHRWGKKYLKALAERLGLQNGTYEVRSNMGGVAVSGEVTLHGECLYVQIQQSCLDPNGLLLLARACRGRKDYVGLTNRTARLHPKGHERVERAITVALEDASRDLVQRKYDAFRKLRKAHRGTLEDMGWEVFTRLFFIGEDFTTPDEPFPSGSDVIDVAVDAARRGGLYDEFETLRKTFENAGPD